MTTLARVRVWDLPTRLFHWLLVLCFVGSFVTAKIGGNAMVWHFRFGYVIGALLLFRLLWGVFGGYWSRFTQFALGPKRVLGYVAGTSHPQDDIGHSPTGAWAVLLMLVLLMAQVATGLLSDDEIAFAGPLTRFVSGAVVGQATGYHKDIGQYVLLGLIALHLLAVAFYIFKLKKPVLAAMLHGDKQLSATTPASHDGVSARVWALVVAALCAGLMAWVAGLG